MILTKTIKSPLGKLTAGVFEDTVCFLEFDQQDRKEMRLQHVQKLYNCPIKKSDHPLLSELESQLELYFSGSLDRFSIPLDIRGTGFQTEIWALLNLIPFGKTISYGELALKAGDIKKVRAVGRANGENRIAILIPCHRVIGSDGSLVGYGGELWRKKKLLELEKKATGQPIQMGFQF